MRHIASFLFMLLFSLSALGQELNCNVTVVHSKIQGTNTQIFETLKEAITDFMNNTSWTNYVYEAHERIECNILFNLEQDGSANDFGGTVQIQARRPIYGSSYNSVLINHVDEDLSFRYEEFDPLEFNENAYVSNLTSILSFYAYIIIGLDSDSYGNMGGEEFFKIAEKIATNAQAGGYQGWKGSDSRKRTNRYWLVDNILDADYKPLREFNYQYHRLGLDHMSNSVQRGRSSIMDSIELIKNFHRNKPDPFMFFLKIILDAKSNEIPQIFSDAPSNMKSRVYSTMVSIDPASGNKYDLLKE